MAAGYGQGLGETLVKALIDLPRIRSQQQIALAQLPLEMQQMQSQADLNAARLGEVRGRMALDQEMAPVRLLQERQKAEFAPREMAIDEGMLKVNQDRLDILRQGADTSALRAKTIADRMNAAQASQQARNVALIIASLSRANERVRSSARMSLQQIVQEAQRLAGFQGGGLPSMSPLGTNAPPMLRGGTNQPTSFSPTNDPEVLDALDAITKGADQDAVRKMFQERTGRVAPF